MFWKAVVIVIMMLPAIALSAVGQQDSIKRMLLRVAARGATRTPGSRVAT
jgi:hypothetical protein